METGTCQILHRHDQFEVRELRNWDFFGECDLLKVIVSSLIQSFTCLKGYTYFGDVVSKSDEVRLLYISKDNFRKIPVYEQLVMKQYCQARQDIAMLSYMFSSRYNIDIKEYNSYY